MNYYLIYKYHDIYFEEFKTPKELWDYLNNLINEYKNDSDFKYKIIDGIKLEELLKEYEGPCDQDESDDDYEDYVFDSMRDHQLEEEFLKEM